MDRGTTTTATLALHVALPIVTGGTLTNRIGAISGFLTVESGAQFNLDSTSVSQGTITSKGSGVIEAKNGTGPKTNLQRRHQHAGPLLLYDPGATIRLSMRTTR